MKEAGAFGQGNRTKVGIVGRGGKKMHNRKRERISETKPPLQCLWIWLYRLHLSRNISIPAVGYIMWLI